MIDKVVRQDDESARKGRRDVADDDGKDQNQSLEVAYQRHKLPAEAHDGRRDDGVQPPVAQEVVEGVPPGKFVENDREPPRKGANIPDKWRFKSRNLGQRPKLGSGHLTKRR